MRVATIFVKKNQVCWIFFRMRCVAKTLSHAILSASQYDYYFNVTCESLLPISLSLSREKTVKRIIMFMFSPWPFGWLTVRSFVRSFVGVCMCVYIFKTLSLQNSFFHLLNCWHKQSISKVVINEYYEMKQNRACANCNSFKANNTTTTTTPPSTTNFASAYICTKRQNQYFRTR